MRNDLKCPSDAAAYLMSREAPVLWCSLARHADVVSKCHQNEKPLCYMHRLFSAIPHYLTTMLPGTCHTERIPQRSERGLTLDDAARVFGTNTLGIWYRCQRKPLPISLLTVRASKLQARDG